jgi:hypothetical protein
LVTCAGFSVAAVWIGISASRHSVAQSKCETAFFSSAGDTTQEGQTMCNIFSWVDIGIMGGLWVVLALAQVRFYSRHTSNS